MNIRAIRPVATDLWNAIRQTNCYPLPLIVVCSGCGFFFTVGLMSRGELTASVLGAELRLWRIVEKNEVGLGFDRAFEIREADRSCTQHYTILLLWKPALAIDNLAYADCS
jgi:hypothetical protein